MEKLRDQSQSPSSSPSDWEETDFYAVIMDVVQDKTSNDKPSTQVSTSEDEASPLLARVLKAAKRFGEGAATLSKAFLWSAATGKLVVPGEPSPLCGKLREEIRDLLAQLRWLERGQVEEDLDETESASHRLWAAQTLATAVRLKILQRATHYCRLYGETLETSERLALIRSMHRYYLKQLARLQHSPQGSS